MVIFHHFLSVGNVKLQRAVLTLWPISQKSIGDICLGYYPYKYDKKIENLPFSWMNIGAAMFVYIIYSLNDNRILIGSSLRTNEKRRPEPDF